MAAASSSWLEHPSQWLRSGWLGLCPGSLETPGAAQARAEEAQEPSWGAAKGPLRPRYRAEYRVERGLSLQGGRWRPVVMVIVIAIVLLRLREVATL